MSHQSLRYGHLGMGSRQEVVNSNSKALAYTRHTSVKTETFAQVRYEGVPSVIALVKPEKSQHLAVPFHFD
jgi:hypothetical protein